MTLAEVRDWLETFGLFNTCYIGKFNGTKENVLGVFARAASMRPPHALGMPSTYVITGVKLVIHGNQNANQTQTLALALMRALTDITETTFEDNIIHYIDFRVSEPMDIGQDANNRYQYVINIDIYSNRR